MKLMRSDDIELIPIVQLTDTDWDVRSTKEDEAGIIALRNSIKLDGIINPLTVVRLDGKLQVIAGRRRLKAAKLAGLDKVPIYIKDDTTSLLTAKRLAMFENCHRKDMLDSERAKAFFMIFEEAGYDEDQVIHGVKAIDNWFSNHTKNKVDWDSYIHNNVMYIEPRSDEGRKENPLVHDKQFVEICKDTGFTPKYQYQIMQVKTQLKPDVLKYAETVGVPLHHQIDLTNAAIREHPKLQKEIITEIAKGEIKPRHIKTRIQQVANDVATGYIKKHEDGSYTRGAGKKREKIKEGDKVLPPLEIAHLDLTKSANAFLFRMTDRAITKSEHLYSDKIVENTKNYRLSVVKASNTNALHTLQNDLSTVAAVTIDMLEMIEKEFESRKEKKEMIGV